MRHVVFGDAGVSHEVLYLALSCMIYSLLQRNPNLRKREAPTTLNYPIRCHSGLDHEQTVRAKMAAPSESISQTFFCQAATFYQTQVYLGSDLWVLISLTHSLSPRGFVDLTDVTLADEDSNSILTLVGGGNPI